jgi:hypothetical protein
VKRSFLAFLCLLPNYLKSGIFSDRSSPFLRLHAIALRPCPDVNLPATYT